MHHQLQLTSHLSPINKSYMQQSSTLYFSIASWRFDWHFIFPPGITNGWLVGWQAFFSAGVVQPPSRTTRINPGICLALQPRPARCELFSKPQSGHFRTQTVKKSLFPSLGVLWVWGEGFFDGCSRRFFYVKMPLVRRIHRSQSLKDVNLFPPILYNPP